MESTSLTHEFRCTIRFRMQFNLRKIKKFFLHPCDFSSPTAWNAYNAPHINRHRGSSSAFSPLQEIRIFQYCSSGADTSTDRGNTVVLLSMIEKRYLLMLNLEYFYFIYRRLNIKANFQVKQVTHYTEVILQETWSPRQPFMSFLHFTLV